VTVQSQRNYESGRRAPDAVYLAALAGDMDVRYILTGLRDGAQGVADTGARYTPSDPLCDKIQRLPARQRKAISELVGSILGPEDDR
jgi:hypothetical protein